MQLIATFSGRGSCFYKLDPRVELRFLSDEVLVGPYRPLRRAGRWLTLRKLIKDFAPDVVVSFLWNVNIQAIPACAGLGLPIVVSERSYPPLEDLYSPYQFVLRKLTYPFADRVVMLTQKGCDWILKNVPFARPCVIPNSVSYPLMASEPVLNPCSSFSSQRKMLLAVGRLDNGKQYEILVRAFASLAPVHHEWDLVILGDGPNRSALERQIADAALASRIRLPGKVGNVGDWYERADLYVLSSRFEGFPNTLAEAMAYGCPVVSYDCDTGPRDIVRGGVDGLLVRPVGDEDALSHALAALMGDERERARMSIRAVEIRERFSPNAVLAKWDRLFDELRLA